VSALEFSKARLLGVLDEIRRLKEGEFPYKHSKEALELLEAHFQKRYDDLVSLPPSKDPQIVSQLCAETLFDIFDNMRLLGFILRSTNVRNAFEVYGPILRLARSIIGVNTKLLLSSEWDFSPFTYPALDLLPNFVLIGIPASESENPLVLPLAGHELGHTLWAANKSSQLFEASVEDAMLDVLTGRLADLVAIVPGVKLSDTKVDLDQNIFVKKFIAVPVQWALRQVQEYFCDAVGLFLFDQAFLQAHAYLIAPRVAAPRSLHYPTNSARVTALVEGAALFRSLKPGLYTVPPGYEQQFEDEQEPRDADLKFRVSLADAAATRLTNAVHQEVATLLDKKGVPTLDLKRLPRIMDDYRSIVPATQTGSLTTILNAAWDVFRDSAFWPEITNAGQKLRVLRELILKNIELLEIEQRLA
jgi:hypothetical protein